MFEVKVLCAHPALKRNSESESVKRDVSLWNVLRGTSSVKESKSRLFPLRITTIYVCIST